jgi:hypothetical protein
MNQLQVDPATGFLQSPSPTGIYNFDAERKTQLLAMAMQCAEAGTWPNIPKLCKSVGISVQTFYNHVNADGDFAEQWQEIKRTLSAGIAVDMREHATRPGNYMDRITLLRHLHPDEWGGPEKNSSNIDIGWIKKLADAIDSANKPVVIATDAVITTTTKE